MVREPDDKEVELYDKLVSRGLAYAGLGSAGATLENGRGVNKLAQGPFVIMQLYFLCSQDLGVPHFPT